MIYRITSRSNQRLKDLLKNKDEYYFFEGEKLVRDILQKKLKVEILIVNNTLETEFPAPEKTAKETWYVNESVLKKLSNLKRTPPMIAVLKLKEKAIDFRKAKVVIVLDNIQDPANAGTVFRCAAAFGVYAVVLSGSSVKPNNPKFLRAAQDAVFHVRFQQVESLDALIKKASSAGMNIYLTSALYPGETVSPGNLRSPCLILFGNEGQGLPPELFLSYPSIKIEQTKKVESLNVGVSACIIMHELKK